MTDGVPGGTLMLADDLNPITLSLQSRVLADVAAGSAPRPIRSRWPGCSSARRDRPHPGHLVRGAPARERRRRGPGPARRRDRGTGQHRALATHNGGAAIMYPGTYAAQTPDRIAAVMAGTGETISYGELERRSAQLAHVLHDGGLRPGDVVALLTENSLRALEVYWAALRSGLYITAVNYRLKPDEVAYIVNDSGAAALIVSAEQAATATALRVPGGQAAAGLRRRGARVRQLRGDHRGRLGHAPGRPAARRHHAVLLRHHRTAQGRAAAAARRPGGRARRGPGRRWPAWPSASTPTRSTCRPGRSTTPRRCVSAARSRPWAAPW